MREYELYFLELDLVCITRIYQMADGVRLFVVFYEYTYTYTYIYLSLFFSFLDLIVAVR